MPVRVGLIGCGRIAQLVHLEILAGLDNVKLVALAEADPARREEAGVRAPAAQLYADYRAMLDGSIVDAVVICLPPALHASSAMDAFRAGKHVYLEKPLAIDLKQGRQVLEAWRESGKIGMIGFNFRFNHQYRDAKHHIASGTLGELVTARSVFAVAARPQPAWKEARSTGGGVILDLASHHVDLIHFLFGLGIRRVTASTRSQRCENDSALIEFQLESGMLVQCFFSMSAIEEHRFEIYGQAGKLTIDRISQLEVVITRPTMPYDRIRRIWDALAALNPRRLMKPAAEHSFREALSHFVGAVHADQPASPDLEDGYRSLAVIEAAEESARTGKAVELACAARASS